MGRTEVLTALVDCKCDVNLESGAGKTALTEAAAWGNLDSASHLLSLKAEPERISKDGHTTALAMAEEFGEDTVLAVFREHMAGGGAKPTATADGDAWNQLEKRQEDIAYKLDCLHAMSHVAHACSKAGLHAVRLVRVAPEYYGWELPERRVALNAPSIDHLCKSIIVENRRFDPETPQVRNNSKYYCVLVQYTTSFSADKVLKHIKSLNPSLSKKHFNFQHAEGCEELTGYSHNSVSPFGMATDMPLILSKEITKLNPPNFWLGGGHVDVKLNVSVEELIAACDPIIADIAT